MANEIVHRQMNWPTRIFLACCILFSANLFAADEIYRTVNFSPPEVPREFRGAWITCVASNADWPSQPGLSVAQQKAELISLLDRAQQLHLNAVIFQVRPASDAMYQSSIEPWSENLTGVQGKAPEPFYDPLAFAIQEAHKRGLELHAWFNPFRAWHPLSKSLPAPNHVSKTHPEWIRHYGGQMWLDPGDPAVRTYVLRVVMDVVKRYDVDGVQFDDYFYPYPEKTAEGKVQNFPDNASWEKHPTTIDISRDDWRRQNINEFIQSVYQNIKAVKPWVKFGVSPFGIWRPGFPPQIKGLDAYANLYADSRLWLQNGWVDYLAPQLYWPVDAPQQSFPVLLNWWTQQNIKGREILAAMNTANVPDKFSANEIARQIQIVRAQPDASGEIYFHLNNILDDGELREIVQRANSQLALTPAISYEHSIPPERPIISVTTNAKGNFAARWQEPTNPDVKWWLVQCRNDIGLWTTQILPPNQNGCVFSSWTPEMVSVRAVDHFGNLSSAAMVEKLAPTVQFASPRGRK